METTRAKAQQVGITGPWIFLAGAAYWTFINAFIEEYIWRGFVYRHCESLISGFGAVSLSALFFTLHHTIALTGYFQTWRVGSIGLARGIYCRRYLVRLLLKVSFAVAQLFESYVGGWRDRTRRLAYVIWINLET